MAAVETRVTKVAGEFPYGPPSPNEVALASGAARVLLRYQLAIEAEQTVLAPGITAQDMQEAQIIAQARFTRAILGSMRVSLPPIEGREVSPPPTDPEATGATNGLAEAQQIHDELIAEIDRHQEKAPYGAQHEAVLEAALLFAADTAEEGWGAREAQDIAASRGYTGVLALMTTTIPDTPATIDEYARAS